MQITGFFPKIIFCSISFKVSAWISNHAVRKIGLKWVGGKTTNLVVLLNSLVLPERIIFHAEAVPEGVHHGAGGLALPQ
jgi:hypothetical protein